MEEILERLGINGAHLIIGLIGGSIALLFGKRIRTWGDRFKALGTVLAGSVITGYITPLVMLWKPSWESADYSIAFAVGLVGMGVFGGIMELIDRFRKDPIGTIKSLKGLFTKH